jgi:hypothetical protein
MQSHSVSDVEPDQEMAPPGDSIFQELTGTNVSAPEAPAVKAKSSDNKMSKARENQGPARTSELYIGGLEEMKVDLNDPAFPLPFKRILGF